jgi:eukaryotic-like serine/threonine-protein kinase
MEPLFDQTAPPERVGPYRIDRAIGRGGMGTVWRARDERLKRQVAIKQICSDSPLRTLQQRLWRVAQAAARLNHPAIVHVYDLVEDAAGAWIVMELVAGRTLWDLMDEQGPLPFAQAARLGLDVAEGLAEAHSHGILHRDLKAANVMVTPSGRAKILDFGLAKQIHEDGEDQEASITRTGVVIGAAGPATRSASSSCGSASCRKPS